MQSRGIALVLVSNYRSVAYLVIASALRLVSFRLSAGFMLGGDFCEQVARAG